MPVTGRYNPAACIASWLGIDILSGVAAGSFLTIGRAVDSFEFIVGVDGENARVRTNNFSGTCTWRLRADSLTNLALSAALGSDEILGTNVGPFFFFNRGIGTSWSCPNAYLERWPVDDFGASSAAPREWSLRCPVFVPVLGGSEAL